MNKGKDSPDAFGLVLRVVGGGDVSIVKEPGRGSARAPVETHGAHWVTRPFCVINSSMAGKNN